MSRRQEQPFDELINSRIEDLTKAIGQIEGHIRETGDKNMLVDWTASSMLDIHIGLKELYEHQLRFYNDLRGLYLMLKSLLGADEYAPVEELGDRAAILGELVDRLRRG
jgi:hypothetical protein